MVDVSIIVPVYNSEKYLKECVESLIGQTKKEIEIIFVDDGSVDNSLKILEEYKSVDKRIRIFKNAHSGGGAARNTGLANAQGRYVTFFDSDDIMECQMVEKMYSKCEKENADMAVCSVRFWHEDTGAVTDEECGLRIKYVPFKNVFSWKDMPGYIFNTFHNWPWNKIFRKSFIDSNHIRFQEIMRTNDLLFTCKALMLSERITVVPEYLVKYRLRTSDSCQATNSKAPLDFYKAFTALKDFLLENDLYFNVQQSFVNHALDGCIANLNTSDFNESQKTIYYALKNEILDKLDISGRKDSYFYPENFEVGNVDKLRQIEKGNYEEYLRYRANELNQIIRYADKKLCYCNERISSLKNQMRKNLSEHKKLQKELTKTKFQVMFLKENQKSFKEQKVYKGICLMKKYALKAKDRVKKTIIQKL